MAWECRERRLDAYVLLDEADTDDMWSGGIVTQLDFVGDSDILKSDGGDQGHDPAQFLVKKSREAAAACTAAVPAGTIEGVCGNDAEAACDTIAVDEVAPEDTAVVPKNDAEFPASFEI